MPTNAPIQFSFAGLPGGAAYCYTTAQRLALDIAAGLSGYLPGQFNKIINSDTEPSVADRIDSLWFKTSEGRLYRYSGGWISPNLADANERRIFVGSESDAWSYDGGSGDDPTTTPPTPTTGAMWKVDTDFSFRFPLGAGTSPAPTSTVVAVGDTGGEEKHTLTLPEIPAHGHLVGTQGGTVGIVTQGMIGVTGFAGISTNSVSGPSAAATPTSDTGGDGTGTTTPHQNMPPYRGVFFIMRTGRQFYVA